MAGKAGMKDMTLEQRFHRSQQYKRRMIISGLLLVLCFLTAIVSKIWSLLYISVVFLTALVFFGRKYTGSEEKVEEELESESRRNRR